MLFIDNFSIGQNDDDLMKVRYKNPHSPGSRVKSRLEKERPERIEPFMKGAQVL